MFQGDKVNPWDETTKAGKRGLDKGKEGLDIVQRGVEATIDKVPIVRELPSMVKQQLFVGGVTTGATALYDYLAGTFRDKLPEESMEEYLEARRKRVGSQMRTYMDNYFKFDPEYSALDDAGRDAFVARYNKNQGGRVGYQTGGISMANTLAQNIAANQAQAAQVQQILQQGRSRLPSAAGAAGASAASGMTPQVTSGGTTIPPTVAPQTDWSHSFERQMETTPDSNMGRPATMTSDAGFPERDPVVGAGPMHLDPLQLMSGRSQYELSNLSDVEYGALEQRYENLPQSEKDKLDTQITSFHDQKLAQMEADEAKYGTTAARYPGGPEGTVDPMVGKQMYQQMLFNMQHEYPAAFAKLTGNETLAELDQIMLDQSPDFIPESGSRLDRYYGPSGGEMGMTAQYTPEATMQMMGGYQQGGRVGLRFGTPEEGIGSLTAGAPDITYKGNEGLQSPQEEKMIADMSPALKRKMLEILRKGEIPLHKIREEAEKELRMDPYIEERMGTGPGPILEARGPSDLGPPYHGSNYDYSQGMLNTPNNPEIMNLAKGGRIGYRMGMGPAGLPGIPRMAPDGLEYDMRMNGGFQPLGAKEGKDDVNAKLAKNEFVFTADAVRGAGGGDIELGAQRMYDTMKNLEKRVV